MRSSATSAAAAVVLAASLVLIGAGSGAVQAFYLPGVAPREFSNGEAVEVKVSSLSSRKTKIPYSYYDFAVCTPKDGVDHAAENLGEVLVGDRIESTPYKVGMAENKKCTVLCKVDLDEEKLKNLRRLVTEEYNVNMLADNLPAATSISTGDGSDVEDADVYYSMGWPTGGSYCAKAAAGEGAACKEEDQKLYFNNHLVFKMFYHTPDAQAQQPIVDVDGSIVTTGGGSDTSSKDGDSGTPKKRLVKFEIEPFSVRHQYDRNKDKFDAADVSTCGSSPIVHQVGNGYDQTLDEGTKDIVYSYAVEWYSSEQKWATRWDIYLTMDESFSDGVHWFSIINSVLIGVFLTTMVAMIMVRTLRRDLARYNRVPTEEEKAEEREESGWKLVHGDVFRPPRAKMVFAVFVGTGVQCLGMAMVVVVFCSPRVPLPANRGSLLTAVLTLFVLMGMVGGTTLLGCTSRSRAKDTSARPSSLPRSSRACASSFSSS